jgi:hypothetical protein
MKPLSIYDTMPVGKYFGELVGTVIEDNPGYMWWAVRNTELDIDAEAKRYLKECSKEPRQLNEVN